LKIVTMKIGSPDFQEGAQTSSLVTSENLRSSSTETWSLTFQRITGAAIRREPARRAQQDAKRFTYGRWRVSKRYMTALPADWMDLKKPVKNAVLRELFVREPISLE